MPYDLDAKPYLINLDYLQLLQSHCINIMM